MLLDDVMSELDAGRRERLVEVLRARRAERDHHDRARRTCRAPTGPDVERVAIADGRVLQAAAGERGRRMRRRPDEAPGPRPVALALDARDRGDRARDAAGARSSGSGRRPPARRSRPTRRPTRSATAWSRVACASAVWAQELDLMSERVVEALNEALGRPAVRRLDPTPQAARLTPPEAPVREPSAAQILCGFAALL